MPTEYDHPAHRVAHCALGAQKIALQLARNIDMPMELRDECTKVALLVSEIPADVAALQELVVRLQEDMRAMCEEGIELAQEVTRLRKQFGVQDAPALSIPLTREPRSAAAGE